jgi:thiosulfate/3-mercaptopyruvate sulfurtransferase
MAMTRPLLVSTDWLVERLSESGIVVVDTRPPFFYAQGHIPGAVNLPLFLLAAGAQPPNGATVGARLGNAGIGAESHVVLYDDGASPTASHAAWILRFIGHANVSVVAGGMTAWASEGKEVEYAPDSRASVSYSAAQPVRGVLAEIADVRGAIDDPNAVIVDVRNPSEYLGLQQTALRNGHIPGAVNLEWSNNLQIENGVASVRPDDDLRAMYGDAGITRDRRVVVHCQSGSRSTFTWLILTHLGYESVLNYAGGWQEWGNRDDTAVEEP